jgi:C-terminal peptidase prc
MSRILAWLGVLLCATPLLAVSRSPSAKVPGPPLTPAEAQAFALQLKDALDLIVKQYARPVERPELVVSALKGLYQAAGASAPAALAAMIKKADATDGELVDAIAQERERLGNPGPLQGSSALKVSLVSALRALDPYCFLTPSEKYLRETDTQKNGLGLEVEKNAGGSFVLKSVTPGGPAQRAGMRPGDRITHFNGRPIQTGKSARDNALLWLWITQGSGGRPFRLTMVQPGKKAPYQVTLKPGPFKAETVFGVDRRDDDSWNYLLDPKNGIAHVRLGALKRGTAADLRQVLEQLRKSGVRGLILDLRWCPGGLLDEAVDVAALLVGDRVIANIDYRDGGRVAVRRRQTGTDAPSFLDVPLVALVNGQTLGGGELIAAAIQDTGRGPVVGQRTVGKGSVQRALTNEQGAFYHPIGDLTIRLSVGIFTRLSGKNLQRFATSKDTDNWGVQPDAGLEYAVSRELSLKLEELWLWQTLRPGSSAEALPLDDPVKDPQRQFALKVLLKKLRVEKAAR